MRSVIVLLDAMMSYTKFLFTNKSNSEKLIKYMLIVADYHSHWNYVN